LDGNIEKEAGKLRSFFWPQGIAVVGASADPAKPGGRVVQLLKDYRYPGRIYPINPKRKEIQGLPACGSLAELNERPDLVIIAVEAPAVPAVVRQCAALQMNKLVVISGGFSETGKAGAALQEELAALAAEHKLTILGPNCIGFINTLQPAVASFSFVVDGGALRSGPAALVVQSGGLGILAIFLADLEKFGFSYMISTGNEVNLDFAAAINFLVHEPRVRVIGGYLEGVKSGERLRLACRAAAEAGKPVILLKAGASPEAVAAIRSHTGAMAGSREAYRAFFRQEGVLEAETLTEMLSLFKAFAPGRLPRGNRAAVLSLSGGMGVLAADLCAAAGLEMARFSPETVRELKKLIPSIATVGNPLDPTAAMLTRLPEVRAIIETVLADPGVDLFIFTTALWRASGIEAGEMMAQLFQQTEKPFFVIWPGCIREAKEIICESGIPFFNELKDGVAAAAATWRYALFQQERMKRKKTALSVPEARLQAEILQSKMSARGELKVTEPEAKQILANLGIAVPRGELAGSLEQAVAAAGRIGYPVVLKAVSAEIIHKTEAGAIKLGLRDDGMLREAWEEMRRELACRAPGIEAAGWLVEEMLPVRLEMIAGAKNDPLFGPLLLLGFGGIHVEIFRDLAMRPAPLDPEQVLEMIGELKSAPLLKGHRGAPPVDTSSLAEAVSRFSHFAAALKGSYREMEINPLVICPDGRAVAADAVILF